MKKLHLTCSCGLLTHIIRISYDAENTEFWFESGASSPSFLQRIKLALRFIFNPDGFIQTQELHLGAEDEQLKQLKAFLNETI